MAVSVVSSGHHSALLEVMYSGHKTHLIVIVDSRLKSLPDLGHELSLGLAPCLSTGKARLNCHSMAKWRLHPDCIRRQWNSSLLLSHWHYWVALLAPTSCTFQRMSPGQNVAKITSTRFRTADCLHNYCHSQLLQAALLRDCDCDWDWNFLFLWQARKSATCLENVNPGNAPFSDPRGRRGEGTMDVADKGVESASKSLTIIPTDDPLTIPKTTNSGAMLTTKKSGRQSPRLADEDGFLTPHS
uniref:HDC09852 n=1 Tax=Drosophila melanogaster TaxID=7227 RepID=Q6ILB7_DROME|nr:TPA_inf: HDC09852 [Drosophila melanogaster]